MPFFSRISQPPGWHYFMAAFLSLATLDNILSFQLLQILFGQNMDNSHPFAIYNGNAGILALHLITNAVNLSIVSAVFLWRRLGSYSGLFSIAIVFFCCAGIFLVWFELWYGSTFYYGEVRDKQGLPYGICNYGILGSFIFFCYLVLQVHFFKIKKSVSIACKTAWLLSFWYLQKTLVYLLQEPWNLWQS